MASAAAAGCAGNVFGGVDMVVRHGRPTRDRSGSAGFVRIAGPDRADVVSPAGNALHLLHVAVVGLGRIVVLCHCGSGGGGTEESAQNVIRCSALYFGIKMKMEGTRVIGDSRRGVGVLIVCYKR